ncbi:hypothetical protein ACLOJK_008964 [Asimina triloba]
MPRRWQMLVGHATHNRIFTFYNVWTGGASSDAGLGCHTVGDEVSPAAFHASVRFHSIIALAAAGKMLNHSTCKVIVGTALVQGEFGTHQLKPKASCSFWTLVIAGVEGSKFNRPNSEKGVFLKTPSADSSPAQKARPIAKSKLETEEDYSQVTPANSEILGSGCCNSMAASANPPGNQEGSQPTSNSNGAGGGVNLGHSNLGVSAPENSRPAQALKHNPGLAAEWTLDEQAILEEGLTRFASDSNIVRYAKIAMQLQDKTVRDVALRCRWMNKKESGKRRKDELTRKSKDRKEKPSDPSGRPSTHLTSRPNVPPYSLPVLQMDSNDGISFEEIGGVTGQRLEQNAHAFRQITANLSAFKIQDNISLLCQARDNILAIMNDLKDTDGVMKQMPPLPVKVNEDLANSILPPKTPPAQS